MGGPVLVAPIGADGAAGNVGVESEEIRKLREVGKKLLKTTKLSKQLDYRPYYREADQLFASVRALKGLSDLLVIQPGYSRGDPAGDVRRAAAVPVKACVDSLVAAIEQKCNPLNPLPATAPELLAAKASYAGDILNILNDTDNTELIKKLREDKSVPPAVKHEFLQALGFAMQLAMEEVLTTKREADIFAAIEATFNSHDEKTMIGACFWAISAAAGSVGSLPGPDSFYIALLKIQSINRLVSIAGSGARTSAMFSEVSAHLTKALKLTPDEEATIRRSIQTANRFPHKAKAAMDEAKEIIKNGCGRFQQTAVFNWGISILNVMLLANAWSSLDAGSWQSLNDPDPQKALDFVNAAITSGSGVAFAIGRTFEFTRLLKLCEKVGNSVGYLAAFTAVVDGICAIREGWAAGDAWKITSGAVQVGAGLLLLAGVAMGVPGLQLAGLIAGLIAGAIQLTSDIIDACKDPLKRLFMQLIKQLRETKSSWDSEPLIKKLGAESLVDALEKTAAASDIGALLIDPQRQQVGLYDSVLRQVTALGINGQEAQALVRYAGMIDSVSDFRTREAQRP